MCPRVCLCSYDPASCAQPPLLRCCHVCAFAYRIPHHLCTTTVDRGQKNSPCNAHVRRHDTIHRVPCRGRYLDGCAVRSALMPWGTPWWSGMPRLGNRQWCHCGDVPTCEHGPLKTRRKREVHWISSRSGSLYSACGAVREHRLLLPHVELPHIMYVLTC